MEIQIYLSELYDYYKTLFTEKQQQYFEDYYFDNLTMDEIAENNKISKNAVSKTILEVKNKLEEYEGKLHLYANHKKIESVLPKDEYEKIKEYI